MKKTKKIIIWTVVVAIVFVAGAVLAVGTFSKNGNAEEMKGSDYTVVYLTTGDIYFGKMDWFPIPRMTNVWFIQRGTDAKNQPQLGLAPFKGLFWSPIDEMYLNPKEIVFWTKVKDGSQLAQALANPSQYQQVPQQQTATPSGFKGPSGAPPANP